MRNLRNLKPIRRWLCLSCKHIYTNNNAIHINTDLNKGLNSLGFKSYLIGCPYCKKKTEVKYLGEKEEVLK